MGRVEISGPGNEYSIADYILSSGDSYTDTLGVAPNKLQETMKIAIGAPAWGGFLDGYDMMGSEGDLEIRVSGSDTDQGEAKVKQADGWRLVTYAHKKVLTLKLKTVIVKIMELVP